MIKQKQLTPPHPIVWDERVYNRVSPAEQYLYELPFFAEIFNALDAYYAGPPDKRTTWLISDCYTLHHLFLVYGTRSKSGLKRHFAQHPYWLPMLSDDDDTGIELHRVKAIDYVGFVRVWLDNNDMYRLDAIGGDLTRDPHGIAQVLALTPFDRRIHASDEAEAEEEDVVIVLEVNKENKLDADERVREEEAILMKACDDMHDQLAVYLDSTRNLRNALALSTLTHTENECCEATRVGMAALYEELGHIEDQIGHITRCQARFCKFMGQ